MRCLGAKATDSDLKRMCRAVDKDGNSVLSFAEFVKLMTTQKGLRSQQKLHDQIAEFRETFGLFDVDGNGEINASELHTVLPIIGLAEMSIEDAESIVKQVCYKFQ